MSTKGVSKFNKYIEALKEQQSQNPNLSNVKMARLIISLYPDDGIDFNAFRLFIGKFKNEGSSVEVVSKSKSNDYAKPKFVLSAWNKSTGKMMNIDDYCVTMIYLEKI